MKVRNLWFVFILILEFICMSGFAGSVESILPSPKVTSEVVPEVKQQRVISGTFIAGEMAHAMVNWEAFGPSPFTSYSVNSTGGLSYGFTVGYRFYPYFSLDGGFYKLPTVRGNGFANLAPTTLTNIGVVSWFGYVLGRFYLSAGIVDYLYITLGAGITYRSIQPKPNQFFSNPAAYYYAPIFSVGLEYDVAQDWLLFFKYYYIPEYNRDLSAQPTKFFNTPNVNLFVFGIGYKFSI